MDEHQLFDGCTSSRARPIENDRGSKISMAGKSSGELSQEDEHV
jgi:hypothetical protein